jgi:molecular chaperone DnaK
MKIIGLDFGTTNSTISYFNEESGTLDSFQTHERDLNYIPTVVAYNINKNHEISIGAAAKRNITSKDFEAYEYFKLLLGKNFGQIIEGKTKTPSQVTFDFLKKLLETYRTGQNIDEIERIVMTVPETWVREASTAIENIEGMLKKLEYGEHNFQLQSEPVAAAAYFCWAYERNKETNPKGKKYNGFITVIDFGGGTLDVTLCEAPKDGTIKILERCGFGEYNETNGCAGVAFDEAVVEKLIRDRSLSIQKGTPKFVNLRNKFEDAKITECDFITKGLKYYYDNPAIMKGEKLFSLQYNDDGDTIDVFCEDLDQCFSKVNAPRLKDSLDQIKQFFSAHNIDSSTQENFKVLLVGGFSNFFPVEKEVRAFFGSTTEDIDRRFEQPFPVRNRALSISRGAALIAANQKPVVTTCAHSYGYIVASRGESDRWVDKYVAVIEKGTDIKTLNKPVYKEKEKPLQVLGANHGIRIYMDDGRPKNVGRIPIGLDESVRELFPNVDDRENDYRIGFTINKNRIPTIYVKDKHGEVRSTSLNKLFERLAIIEK